MQQEEPIDWYQRGVQFARKVQEGLREGQTFEEMNTFPPMHAAHIRDVCKGEGYSVLHAWWDGYVSQWD